MQDDPLVYFNGIQANTVEYLLPPLTPRALSRLIQDETLRSFSSWPVVLEMNAMQANYRPRATLDPRDLAQTGWGVIFAATLSPTDLAQLRYALEALLGLRQEQVSGSMPERYHEFSGSSGYHRGESPLQWLTRQGQSSSAPPDPTKVPYYLLLVGDPETIPLSFEWELGINYAVGRLHFDPLLSESRDDLLVKYARYAESVFLSEAGSPFLPRRAHVFGATHPEDPVTQHTLDTLLGPLADDLSQERWEIDISEGYAAVKEHLYGLLNGDDTPALLFTATHGLSFSPTEPRWNTQQGALLCADWPGPREWESGSPLPESFYFTAEDVTPEARLLGSVIFNVSSFSAAAQHNDGLPQLLTGLGSAQGARLSPLAQRFLGHPQGSALAVIGYLNQVGVLPAAISPDITFSDLVMYRESLRKVMNREPVGSCMQTFKRRSATLAGLLDAQLGRSSRGQKPEEVELVRNWIEFNNARNVLTLGDPAVRLPLTSGRATVVERPVLRPITATFPASIESAQPAPRDQVTPAVMEEAYRRLIRSLVALPRGGPVSQHGAAVPVLLPVYVAPGSLGPDEPVEFGEGLELANAVERYTRLLVVGEAGSGKTSSLRYLEQFYADPRNIPDLLPVFVSLRQYEEAVPLDRFLKTALSSLPREFAETELEQTPGRWLADNLETYLVAGRLVLLFDGLDELEPNSRLTSSLLDQLREMASDYPATRIVVTSRPNNFQERVPEYQLVTLLPWTDEQISSYLAAVPQLPGANLATLISSDRRILSLARNPLSLSHLVQAVVDNGLDVPIDSDELYRLLLISLINSVNRRGESGLDLQFVIVGLAKLASAMRSADVRALPYSAAVTSIEDPRAAELIDTAYKAGILDGVAQRAQVRFSHMTYQDYFAGLQSTTAADATEGQRPELRHRLSDVALDALTVAEETALEFRAAALTDAHLLYALSRQSGELSALLAGIDMDRDLLLRSSSSAAVAAYFSPDEDGRRVAIDRSAHRALERAAAQTTGAITAWHILLGLMDAPQSEAAQWLARATGQGPELLRQVVTLLVVPVGFTTPGGLPDLVIGLHRWTTDSYVASLSFTSPRHDVTEVRRGVVRLALDQLRVLEVSPRDYGAALGRSLFEDRYLLQAYASFRLASVENSPLRLRLAIGPSAPELHALRWEMMLDPAREQPLAITEDILFSRVADQGARTDLPLRSRAALRALVAIAQPSDAATYNLATIDVAGEVSRAIDALGDIPVSLLTSAGEATIETIMSTLDDGYDILYMLCHGGIVQGEQRLWLLDVTGRSAVIAGRDFVDRIRRLRRPPALIFMATSGGEASATEFGPELIYAGVEAVVLSQSQVSLNTITTFAPLFFRELLRHGEVDRAVSAARIQIRDRFDFWVPVLYTGPAGPRIWDELGPGETAVSGSASSQTLSENAAAPAADNYSPLVVATPAVATVGEDVRLRLELVPASSGDALISLPRNAVDLNCFLTAGGMSIVGPNALPIHRDPASGRPASATFTLRADLRGRRPLKLEVFAEDPTTAAPIRFEVDGSIQVNPPQQEVALPPLQTRLDIRVAAQPDFLLRAAASQLEDGISISYLLSSRLPGLMLDNAPVGGVSLRNADLQRLRTIFSSTLRLLPGRQPEDARAALLSFGAYLFDLLFPPSSAADFRRVFWQAAERLNTWLVVEDAAVWCPLPWELVAPYRPDGDAPPRLLGEHYQIARWAEGLGTNLHGQVPLGEVALVHYKHTSEQQKDEDLQAWARLLRATAIAQGMKQLAAAPAPFHAMHLLRDVALFGRRDMVPREGGATNDPEQELPQARLELRWKQPVVTLSMLDGQRPSADPAGEGWLLAERALPFLLTGASAVVGPWWATSREGDEIFWGRFYELLHARVRLGEAVRQARLAVAQALPERGDWLAYGMYGDPRARPYWPEESEGYAVLECLNAEGPLRVGTRYEFRASLRSRPPLNYQERLVQTGELPEGAQALFLAPGLLESGALVQMQRNGRTFIEARIVLTPTAPGRYPLQVKLFSGEEHLKTLRLMLHVGDVPAGGSDGE